jgi:hypothetical protein
MTAGRRLPLEPGPQHTMEQEPIIQQAARVIHEPERQAENCQELLQ